MSKNVVNITYREDGNGSFVEIEIEDYNDLYVSEYIEVTKLLKVVAEIIDKNSFYKDIFDSRIF